MFKCMYLNDVVGLFFGEDLQQQPLVKLALSLHACHLLPIQACPGNSCMKLSYNRL